MSSDVPEVGDKKKYCPAEKIYIPWEVRIKYFPKTSKQFEYDLLPLYQLDDFKKRLAKEYSILENASFASKWQAFKEGLPESARGLKRVALQDRKIAVFANYRRQKVLPEYYTAYIGPSSPSAIFRRMK